MNKPLLVAIDIGNTNIEFGIYMDDLLKHKFRMKTNRDITSDELGVFATQFLQINGLERSQVADIVISSVVPQVMYSVNNAIRKYFLKKPYVVCENFPVNIVNKYANPKEVGADRLVNSFSAFKKYRGPLIVVDFGTATTFDAISREGEYLGGSILPGIKISMDALFNNAAKLPKVELAEVEDIIGKTTVDSMQSGAFYGYRGAAENIIKNMKKELGDDTTVIATGGLSTLFAENSDSFDIIDKSLTIDGLYLVYYDNIDIVNKNKK